MSTPTLREAARQALDALGVSESLLAQDKSYHHPQVLKAYNDLSAALTKAADAGAAEPFGYWHQGATEEESDFFKHGDMGNVACEKCITLYAAPPAQQLQQAVARALEEAARVCDQLGRDWWEERKTGHNDNTRKHLHSKVHGAEQCAAAIRQQGTP